MLERLRQHITARVGEDAPHIDEVLKHFRPLQVRRNTQLLRLGDVCKHVYFIAAGSLQVYVYDSNYNETTRDIVLENHWCSELMSFGEQKPATENIRAIEDCDLLAISYPSFQGLMQSVPQFAGVYQQLLQASYASSVNRINTLVSLSAQERIRWLRETRPALLERVSSKLIASYLGISQETYSRLKNKPTPK